MTRSPARFNIQQRLRDTEKAERQQATIELLESREAAGTLDSTGRTVLNMLRARAAGDTRQKTAAEIASQIAVDQADPLAALNRRRSGAGLPAVQA